MSALARRRSRRLMALEHHHAMQVSIRGKRWHRLARSLSPRWRPPTIPARRRIHGLSAIQKPACKASKCRCRPRKPYGNLPMRCRRSRTRCGARLHDEWRQPTHDCFGCGSGDKPCDRTTDRKSVATLGSLFPPPLRVVNLQMRFDRVSVANGRSLSSPSR